MAAAVKVNLIQGKDLVAMDHTGKSDPYCIISAKSGKSHAKSKCCVQTLHPTWNQIFTIDLKNRKDSVVIQVFDRDLIGKDDPMGCVEISMENFHKNKEETNWYKLEGVDTGEIRVGFMLRKRRKQSKDSEDFEESEGNTSEKEEEAYDDL